MLHFTKLEWLIILVLFLLLLIMSIPMNKDEELRKSRELEAIAMRIEQMD